MRELLMALGSCALVLFIIPAVFALIFLASVAWKFWPRKESGS